MIKSQKFHSDSVKKESARTKKNREGGEGLSLFRVNLCEK